MTETLLTRVLRHEGFSEKVYYCSEGKATIGHGLTYLTEGESEQIVRVRLEHIQNRLRVEHGWLNHETPAKVVVVDVLTEMCFQLGYVGCHNFKNMWAALENENYYLAANEMLDSKWHKQTKARCEELAGIIRGLA